MGLTVPQQNLMLALADLCDVYAEYPIPTKMARDTGYPTCYKVDIAIPEKMVAIEIDGNSHCAIERQQQDLKKEQFLNGLGWTVLRFKNKQVMEHLEDCVQTVMSTISK
jgi:very-short-patch-repair endonuclease